MDKNPWRPLRLRDLETEIERLKASSEQLAGQNSRLEQQLAQARTLLQELLTLSAASEAQATGHLAALQDHTRAFFGDLKRMQAVPVVCPVCGIAPISVTSTVTGLEICCDAGHVTLYPVPKA